MGKLGRGIGRFSTIDELDPLATGHWIRRGASTIGRASRLRCMTSSAVQRQPTERMVIGVKVRMLAGLTEAEQSDAFRILQSMIHSLRDGNGGAKLAPRRTSWRARTGLHPSGKTRAGDLEKPTDPDFTLLCDEPHCHRKRPPCKENQSRRSMASFSAG
jgi:hypothetical protein